jgi:hypothetical protein
MVSFNLRNFYKGAYSFSIFIASHVITLLLVLLLIATVICLIIFYNTFYLIGQRKIDISGGAVLKQPVYEEILGIWRENEKKFDEADSKNYENIFRQDGEK